LVKVVSGVASLQRVEKERGVFAYWQTVSLKCNILDVILIVLVSCIFVS